MCITDVAKILKIRPKELFSFMSSNGWIYKRVSGPWKRLPKQAAIGIS